MAYDFLLVGQWLYYIGHTDGNRIYTCDLNSNRSQFPELSSLDIPTDEDYLAITLLGDGKTACLPKATESGV